MKGEYRFKSLLILTVLLISMFASFFVIRNTTQDPTDEWWDDRWPYRREITIYNGSNGEPGEELTDYQLLIEPYASIFGGHTFLYGRDIRFRGADPAIELSYWIEHWSETDTSRIWVKIPSIPADGTTIYMYYGYEYTSSESDGDSVFIAFDDFESYTVGQGIDGIDGWIDSSNNVAEIKYVDNSKVLEVKREGLSDRDNIGYEWAGDHECVIHFDLYPEEKSSQYLGYIYGYESSGTNVVFVKGQGNDDWYWYDNVQVKTFTPNMDWPMDTWKTYDFILDEHTLKCYAGGSGIHEGGLRNDYSTGIDHWRWQGHATYDSCFYVDNFYVRLSTTSELTIEFGDLEEEEYVNQEPYPFSNDGFGNGYFRNPIKNPDFNRWYFDELDGGWTANYGYCRSTNSLDEGGWEPGPYSVHAHGQSDQYFIMQQVIDDPIRLRPFLGQMVSFSFAYKGQYEYVDGQGQSISKERARAVISYTSSYPNMYVGQWHNIVKDEKWDYAEVIAPIPEDATSITVQIYGDDEQLASEGGDGFDTLIDCCKFRIVYTETIPWEAIKLIGEDEYGNPVYESYFGESVIGYYIGSMYTLPNDPEWGHIDLTMTMASKMEGIDEEDAGIKRQKEKVQYIPVDGEYDPGDEKKAVININEYLFVNTEDYTIDPAHDNDRLATDVGMGITIEILSFVLGLVGGHLASVLCLAVECSTAILLPFWGWGQQSTIIPASYYANDGIAECDFDFDRNGQRDGMVDLSTTIRMHLKFARSGDYAQNEYSFQLHNEMELHSFYKPILWGNKVEEETAIFSHELKLTKIDNEWKLVFSPINRT